MLYEVITQEILSPLYTFINKNTSLLPEEKNIQLLLSEKFMNNLRPFTWFIITVITSYSIHYTKLYDVP